MCLRMAIGSNGTSTLHPSISMGWWVRLGVWIPWMHGYLPSPKKNVEYAGEISFSFYCLWVWAYQCKRLTLLVMEVRPLIRDAFIYYSIKLRNFLCASYDNPIRMNIRPFGSCGWLVTKLIYSATCLQYWCRLFNLWGTISC